MATVILSQEDQAFQIISEHVEFFAAPFWQPYYFKTWAVEYVKRNPAYNMFNHQLINAIGNHNILAWNYALIGRGGMVRDEGALRNNFIALKLLLKLKPEVAKVINEFFQVNMAESWYQKNIDGLNETHRLRRLLELRESDSKRATLTPTETRLNLVTDYLAKQNVEYGLFYDQLHLDDFIENFESLIKDNDERVLSLIIRLYTVCKIRLTSEIIKIIVINRELQGLIIDCLNSWGFISSRTISLFHAILVRQIQITENLKELIVKINSHCSNPLEMCHIDIMLQNDEDTLLKLIGVISVYLDKKYSLSIKIVLLFSNLLKYNIKITENILIIINYIYCTCKISPTIWEMFYIAENLEIQELFLSLNESYVEINTKRFRKILQFDNDDIQALKKLNGFCWTSDTKNKYQTKEKEESFSRFYSRVFKDVTNKKHKHGKRKLREIVQSASDKYFEHSNWLIRGLADVFIFCLAFGLLGSLYAIKYQATGSCTFSGADTYRGEQALKQICGQ